MKVVRESKFRHVFGDAGKDRYEDLRLSSKATESCGIRGNEKFFAFPWDSGGGGTLAVLPITKFGRMPRDIPLITGHTGPILDHEFNPFDDTMVMTCSEDLTIKAWQIPEEGLKSHMKDPLLTLEGHGKKISFCTFNPSAANIVASSSFDMTCRTWNLETQEEAYKLEIPEQVMHLKWNHNGSILAATCKDKKLRMIDPRQSKIISETQIHTGVKASKVEWLSSTSNVDFCNKLVTTGFSAQAERQIGVWDVRKFSSSGEDTESLNLLTLDQGTGALYPFFDAGTQMLFVAGKGDANVRFFEAVDQDPYLHYISDFRSTQPQKGFCFLPKRCMDVGKHEVMRGLKLESTAVQPVSFKVPRKSEVFQEDLFPDCPAGVPGMTGDDWMSGAEGKTAPLRSMRPGEAAEASMSPQKSMGGVVSVKDLKKQLAEAQARIGELEKENAELKAELGKK